MNVFVDYKCNKCNHMEEKFMQNYGAKRDTWPVFHCTTCKTGMLQRILSPTTAIFKGKDWPSKDIKRK